MLAILCLSALPQALLYSFYCCVLMFRVCGNQHNQFIANINKKVGPEISVVGVFFSIRDLLIGVFFIFYLVIYLFHEDSGTLWRKYLGENNCVVCL